MVTTQGELEMENWGWRIGNRKLGEELGVENWKQRIWDRELGTENWDGELEMNWRWRSGRGESEMENWGRRLWDGELEVKNWR